MIHNYGLLWHRERIYWGKGGKGDNSAHLKGMERRKKKTPGRNTKTVDFREQIGVYALYHNFKLVYIGQTGARAKTGKKAKIGKKAKTGKKRMDFYTRLNQHTADSLADRWNRFSWFGIRKVRKNRRLGAITGGATPKTADILNTLEALMISISEPKLNRQGGTWRPAKEYFQWWNDKEQNEQKDQSSIAI